MGFFTQYRQFKQEHINNAMRKKMLSKVMVKMLSVITPLKTNDLTNLRLGGGPAGRGCQSTSTFQGSGWSDFWRQIY
jgi:hypothetical protein